MKFDANIRRCGLFDDSNESLVNTLSDSHRLGDELVPSHRPRWTHRAWSIGRSTILFDSRIHLGIVGPGLLHTAGLCCNRDHSIAASDEGPVVLVRLFIMQEKVASVNMHHAANSLLSCVFLDGIIVADLRAIFVNGYSAPSLVNLSGNVGSDKRTNVPLLIKRFDELATGGKNDSHVISPVQISWSSQSVNK